MLPSDMILHRKIGENMTTEIDIILTDYMIRKEAERGIASIEGYADASIQGLG